MLVYSKNEIPSELKQCSVVVSDEVQLKSVLGNHDVLVIFESVDETFLVDLSKVFLGKIVCKVKNEEEGLDLFKKKLISEFFTDDDLFPIKKLTAKKNIEICLTKLS